MDKQDNNDNCDLREIDMDVSDEDDDDDDDDALPVFNNMQDWAYASISFLEFYDIGDMYETLSTLVAIVIILFQATNSATTTQDRNQNDELPKAKE